MSLKDTLKRLQEIEKKEEVEWEKIKENWRASIKEAKEKIVEWFKDMIAENLVVVENRERVITEDYMGTYKVEDLVLHLSGNYRIIFEIRGRNILGANGRIDIYREGLKQYQAMLLLFEKDGKYIWEIWETKEEDSRREFNKESIENLIEKWVNYGR